MHYFHSSLYWDQTKLSSASHPITSSISEIPPPFHRTTLSKDEIQALGVILINGSHLESGHLLMWHNIRKREKFFDIKKPHGIGSAARVDVGFIGGGFDEVSCDIVEVLFSA